MPRAVPRSLRSWLESARDWKGTELGPVASWPPVLLTVVASCLPLGSITILWGPRFLRIYGPDYARILGDRHPELLGEPAAEAWPDVWASMAPHVDKVLRTGDVITASGVVVTADRHGFDERMYADVTYTPIRDHTTGDVLGIAVSARDTTHDVLDRARADALARLARVSVARRSTPSTARRAIAAVNVAHDDITSLATVLKARRSKSPNARPSKPGGVRTAVETSADPTPGFPDLVERVQACLAEGCKQLGAGCRFATMTTDTPDRSSAPERAIPLWSDGTQAAAECRKLHGHGGVDDVGRLVVALDPSIRNDDAQRAFLAKTTEQVSRIITDARAGDADRAQLEQLERALETNRVIGAAMGILVALRHVQPDEAFDLLRQASQNSNRPLHDISQEVVLTGTLPEQRKRPGSAGPRARKGGPVPPVGPPDAASAVAAIQASLHEPGV